jgi:putative DNA primase/helicase
LVRCHAGCEQEQVIAALRSRGLWAERGLRSYSRHPASPIVNRRPGQDDARRSKDALAIWQSSIPARGTLVETYLRSRELHLPQPSPMLRFHAGLKHPSGGRWPAMVALVTRGTDDARGGAKAPVDPQKMMLGPCRGGAVRLGDPTDLLMVGEGIETCLAAMQATGNPTWAALSTSGLRTLDLPKDVHNVIVLADGDDAGEAAARDCAWRWMREGRRVRIARPPQGMDFNGLVSLKKEDRAAFEVLRAELKDAGCRMTALDEAIDEENVDTGGVRMLMGRAPRIQEVA